MASHVDAKLASDRIILMLRLILEISKTVCVSFVANKHIYASLAAHVTDL